MSSKRLIDPVTYRRYRPVMSKQLLPTSGHGGPAPGPGLLGPAVPVNPIAPGSAPANAAGNVAQQLSGAVQTAMREIIPGAQLVLGVMLLVVGLLLAAGQGRRIARAGRAVGLAALTRGAVR